MIKNHKNSSNDGFPFSKLANERLLNFKKLSDYFENENCSPESFEIVLRAIQENVVESNYILILFRLFNESLLRMIFSELVNEIPKIVQKNIRKHHTRCFP